MQENDIDQWLSGISRKVPKTGDAEAFEHILHKLKAPEPASEIRFVQLRNAGILLLLIIAVNVAIVTRSGNSIPANSSRQETAPYLQPYNLNLY